ncbi:family 16 glycosylhydrolase [Deinococcus ficus]|uniref:family 16 glycosylhydrolase n=1 Tax=Deinococcus ficus TaxID=317577 RepID=UPI0003FF2C5D|nr:family 16 glycosylhydrolase [Deinococcus ficus]
MTIFDNLNWDLSGWTPSGNTYTPFWAKDGITGTWNADNVTVVEGYVRLQLNVTKNGETITAEGAELVTNAKYGYGTYEFSLRGASTSPTPFGAGAAVSGMVSAGFSYLDPSITEIDVELQSHQPTIASVGHWNTLDNKEHQDIDTAVNLSQDFHTYKYVWTPEKIDFYIDGALVRTNTTNIPTQEAYFIFNLWPTNTPLFGGYTVQSGTYYMYADFLDFTPLDTSIPPSLDAVQRYPKAPTSSGGGGGGGYPFVDKIASNSKLASDSWMNYRYGISYMATFDQTGWPILAGTIVTDNSAVDAGFTKQFAYPAAGTEMYMRSGLWDGGWSEWQEFGATPEVSEMVVKIPSNSKLPQDPWNTYGFGITYMAYFQNSEPDPLWPTSSGTVITENIMGDPTYVRQVFNDTGSTRSFTRMVKNDGTWSDWIEGSGGSGTSLVAKEAILQNSNPKGMITFIMDDGFIEDFTIMYPMLAAKGYPGVVAMITSYIDNPIPERLSVNQLLTLQSAGWEIASHTVNHPFLAQIPIEQARIELKQSKATLEAAGLKVTNFVYPYGNHDENVRNAVRELYRAGFGTESNVNKMPLKQMDIDRVPMGSFLTAGKDTADYYKSMVDRAKNENVWVIFLLHTGPNQQSAQQTQYIQETVDYIAAQGVPVVTAEQGLNVFGNNLDAGDYPFGDYTLISRDGKLYTNSLSGLISKVAQQTFTNASPASAFPVGLTYMVVGGADNGGFPMDVGTLRVEKMHPDNGFTRQTFIDYATNRTFIRNWNGASWTAWSEQKSENVFMSTSIQNINFGTVAPHAFSDIELAFPNIGYGDNVIANPIYGLEGGLVWNVYPKSGSIILRVSNITANPITPTVQDWTITPLNTV